MRQSKWISKKRWVPAVMAAVLSAPVLLAAEAHSPRSLWEDLDRQRVAQRVDRWVETAAGGGKLEAAWAEAAAEARGYGALAVDALAARARSRDPVESRTALALLGKIGGALAAPALIDTVRRGTAAEQRLAALELLVEGNDYPYVARLLALRSSEEHDPDLSAYLGDIFAQAGLVPRALEAEAELGRKRALPAADPRVREAVREIVSGVVDRGSVRRDGRVIARTRSLPDSDDRRRVLALGPAAVPALAAYAREGSGFEWNVARIFLRDLGGAEVVRALAGVAADHPDPEQRLSALSTLVDGSNFVALTRMLLETRLAGEPPQLAAYARQTLEDGGLESVP